MVELLLLPSVSGRLLSSLPGLQDSSFPEVVFNETCNGHENWDNEKV